MDKAVWNTEQMYKKINKNTLFLCLMLPAGTRWVKVGLN